MRSESFSMFTKASDLPVFSTWTELSRSLTRSYGKKTTVKSPASIAQPYLTLRVGWTPAISRHPVMRPNVQLLQTSLLHSILDKNYFSCICYLYLRYDPMRDMVEHWRSHSFPDKNPAHPQNVSLLKINNH